MLFAAAVGGRIRGNFSVRRRSFGGLFGHFKVVKDYLARGQEKPGNPSTTPSILKAAAHNLGGVTVEKTLWHRRPSTAPYKLAERYGAR